MMNSFVHRILSFFATGRRGRGARFRTVAWCALAAALVTILPLWTGATVWSGIALGATAALVGARLNGWAALPVALAGTAALAVGGSAGPVWPGVVAAGALLAPTLLAAHLAARRRRSAEARAARGTRRARLLSAAATTLYARADRDALLASLPQLLGDVLAFEHATVFRVDPGPDGSGTGESGTGDEPPKLRLVAGHLAERGAAPPPGLELPVDSVVGDAARRGVAIYLPDVRRDGRYVDPPRLEPRLGSSRSELALPIRSDDRVVAVLDLESGERDAFGPDDRSSLAAFVRIAEDALERLDRVRRLERSEREQAFVARLNRELLHAEELEEIAATVLGTLVERFDVDAGALLVLRGDRFEPLATVGDLPRRIRDLLTEGLSYGSGLLHRAWSERRSIFVEDYEARADADPAYRDLGVRGAALVPIVNSNDEVEALLEIGSLRRPLRWDARERSLLELLATTLGVALERAVLRLQFAEMLTVVRSLAQFDDESGDPRVLYRRAAEAAMRVVPGAEGASILRRSSDGFRFVAAIGFDAEALYRLPPSSEAEQLVWYGRGAEAFRSGAPRLLTGDAIARASAAGTERPAGSVPSDEAKRSLFAEAGRVEQLRATIAAPIVYQGEVTGVLNLDSLSRADAFGAGALRLAEAFAQQVGVIFRQAEYREALQRAAITDALTGLGNREGFDRAVRAELSRAGRYDHPVSLVMIDLDGFKRINDGYGHHVGDEALVRVARAMQRSSRASDKLFRWGGDEFALLLPHTPPDEASAATGRYLDAIRSVRVEDVRVDASVGIASFPRDGRDADALLRLADELLYRAKDRAGRRGASAPDDAGGA